ncbi:AAA family ATPase [Macrococcus animalis]|uniref:AAA family ATPase n=1 Tax=Macrococcus animalis TaxID=3395467 RepID=UPI0039BE4796
MRPNRLLLKSFGPFKEETIHFDKLQNHKLFLISGKTGAGKTTIFDGMMYALFGSASTSDRDETNLRNINAADDEPTEVIFNFYMQDKQYEIHRDLPFIKAGNKTKKSTSLNVYEVIDGKNKLITTGLKAGNDAIQAIVKLNAAQFRKIFILPQGEFKSLLVSGSKEKSEILRTLFDTTKIKSLSLQLRDKVANEQKTILAMEAELGIQFGLFQPLVALTDEETYQSKLVQIETAINGLNQSIEAKETQLSKERTALKAQENEVQKAILLTENINAFKLAKQSYDTLLEYAKDIQSKEADLKHLVQFEHYQVTNNDLVNAKTKQSKYETDLVNHQNKLKDTTEKITTLQAQLNGLYKQTDDMHKKKHYVIQNERYKQSKYAQISQHIENNTIQLDALDKEIKALISNKNELETTEKERVVSEKKRLILDVETNTLETKMTKVTSQIDVLTKITTQLNRIDTAYAELKAIEKEMTDIKSKLQALHSSEAVQDVDAIQRLKSSLKIGDKCPICAHTIEILDDDTHLEAHQFQVALERQQLAYQQKQTTLNIYMNEVDRIPQLINIYSEPETIVFVSEMDQLNTQLAALSLSQIGTVSFNMLLQQLEAIIKQFNLQLERAKTEYGKFIEESNSLLERTLFLDDTLKQAKIIDDKLAAKQKELSKLEQLKQSNIQEKSSFIDETNETDYDVFASKFEGYKKEYLQFEKTVEKTEKELRQYEKEQLKLSENITSLSQQLEDINTLIQVLVERLAQINIPSSIMEQYAHLDIKQTVDLFEREIKDYHNKYLTLTNEMNRLELQINHQSAPDLALLQNNLKQQTEAVNALHANVSTMQEQHKTYTKHYEKLKQQLNAYDLVMSDVRSLILLSNALNGINPQKIDIETYVLMYYLEQTLLLANVRLRQMTSNRYELRRRTEKRGGGKQGLVIDVFDYNANQARSISSLSGGETFLASLCLALGLSDFVMQNAGGINLEAVFIDEGFGTLDNETLEVAINALIELQTSGKLIGMISHVQLLKERIPALLKIETNGFESHAVFEIR